MVEGCQPAQKDVPAQSPRSGMSRPAMGVEGFVARGERLERIINATGSLLANESVQISPERAGKLVHLEVRESSFVKKGALLAKIDDQELQAQLNKLEVQERMAAKDVERSKALRAIEAVPQEELERLQNAWEQIQADIALTKIQIEKSQIRAPFAGLLGLRNVSLGAYLSPNESIIELQQINPLKLEFDVPEKYMRDIATGQKVSFDIVGFENPFEATIYAASIDVNPSTRSFKVRARCANPGRKLKPGNFAKVEVITGVNAEAIMLPSDAVIPVIDGQKVMVAKSGKVEERMVETGSRRGIMIEIQSGVLVGDTVIVTGLLALSSGMDIEISDIVKYDAHLN